MLSIKKVVREFDQLLGKDKVMSSELELRPYKVNTIGFSRKYYDEYILAVLKPSSTEEVQSIVQMANTHNIPLYPVSTGRNWGYGSMAPTARGSFIVDLHDMNKIREVNKEIGYVIIEPGVTQEKLTMFLGENCKEFIMDKTGTPAATSILGNVLERGFGLRACRDKLVNGFEIVAGDGNIFRTGAWGTTGTPFYRYTMGPLTDHLFCQSNFGIVTAMALKLYPRPEQFNAIYCTIPRKKLLEVIKEIQFIKKHDLNTFCKIFFDRQYISSSTSPFFVMFFMYGQCELLKIRTDAIIRKFSDLGETILKENIKKDQNGAGPQELLSAFLHPDSTREADVSNYMFRDFDEISVPNYENLDEVDDFGLRFYDCIIPMEIKVVERTLDYLSNIIDKKYKLSRRTTLHAYDHETLVVVNYIVFNRKDKNAVKRATLCVDELYENNDLLAIRATPWHMKKSYEGRKYLSSIKNVFDPKGIIAPGRYV
jgi:4-cresol dehydrogenase (hydroxylating) flavoprotein subunit